MEAADRAVLELRGALGEELGLGRLLRREEVRVSGGGGGGGERAPVELGEDPAEEVGVELHLLDGRLDDLQPERVAGAHALHVRRQEVVRQEPHLAFSHPLELSAAAR